MYCWRFIRSGLGLCLTLIPLVVAGSVSAQTGKSFEQIMQSVSAAGTLPNGDGHRWTFRSGGDGVWKVEGARGNVARVTDAGPDAIGIDGFPDNWGANGRFLYSEEGGKCRLKSDHSGHKLKWKC